MKPKYRKSKRANNRKRMWASNKMVREFLLKNEFDGIWFKPHTKRSDIVYTQRGTYLANDLWNLFDGMCFAPNGKIVFLQMKTNNWAKEEPIKFFQEKHKVVILSFNVTNKLKDCRGKWKVFVRTYE